MSASPPRRSTSTPARIVSWACFAAAFFASLGFLFHTSHWPEVLGKYSVMYVGVLAVWFLVIVPTAYFVPRFLLSTNTIKLLRGDVAIRPRHKLTAAVILGLAGYIGFNWLLDYQFRTMVATRNPSRFHPYLQNTPRPGNVLQHINRWGFRGDEIELEKPAGAYRIFCFGGSTMYCGTVEYEESHCCVLQRELQKAYPGQKIEVQNLGAEWHCTEHSLIKLLTDAQDFQPDLVVMFHGINDLIRTWSPDDFADGPFRRDYGHYLGATANLVRPGNNLGSFSRAMYGHWFSDFRFQQVRLDGPYGKGLNGTGTLFFPKCQAVDWTDWKSLPSFRRNMQEFVRSAKGKGMQVVLATQPSLYRDDLSEHEWRTLIFPISQQFDGRMASFASMARGMRRFNDTARSVAEEENVPLVDLDAAVPKQLKYMYDDVHYTPAGNDLVGRTMARAIVDLGLIEPGTSATSTQDGE